MPRARFEMLPGVGHFPFLEAPERTEVLLDVLGADPGFGELSREALRRAYDRGALVACNVVWSEVRAHFPEEAAFLRTVSLLGIEFDSIAQPAAQTAGRLWRRYCERHRWSRDRGRVITDFLIGAHALHQADSLLCRDRGFFGRDFEDLELIDPTAG